MKEVRSAYAYSLIGSLLLVGCCVHGFSRPPSSHRRLSSFQRTRAPRSMLPDRRPTIRAAPPSSRASILLRAEPEPSSESTRRESSSNPSPTPNDGLLEALRDASIEASREALSALRWGAAVALTKSLPPERRDELLSCMGRDNPEGRTAEAAAPTIGEERGSVQEEIAAAVAEETRRDKERWEKEKERMAKRMEDAVNERVKNEIAVQTKRFEEEQKRRIAEAEAERRRLEEETRDLKERLDDQRVVAKVESGGNELEETESLLRKRERQRAELDAVEENLRKRVREIERKKARLTELMEEVEGAASKRRATATAVSSGAVPDDDEVPHYSPKEYRNLSGEDKAKLKSQREAMGQTSTTEAIDDDAHPILGPVVSDLGYKRVHLVPSGKLGTIPIWNRNRIYRHDRAKSMAIDKSKTMHLGFPGVVCLHEDKDGKLSILDGQHRVGMMAALREKRNEEAEALGKTDIAAEDDDYMFDRILVEVYPQPPHSDVASDEHAEEVFVEINKSEPIKLVDMPGVASSTDRKLITDAVSNLERRYPQMFSPSQKCRVPNVNVDNLRNSIFGADILKRHKLKSSKQLFDWLLVQNAALGGEYATDDDRRSIVNAKAWRKASSNDFYLGLRSSWLYK